MKKSSAVERRVTISPTLYPRIQEFALRDKVTAADIVNAILLQTLGPYGSAFVLVSDAPKQGTNDVSNETSSSSDL